MTPDGFDTFVLTLRFQEEPTLLENITAWGIDPENGWMNFEENGGVVFWCRTDQVLQIVSGVAADFEITEDEEESAVTNLVHDRIVNHLNDKLADAEFYLRESQNDLLDATVELNRLYNNVTSLKSELQLSATKLVEMQDKINEAISKTDLLQFIVDDDNVCLEAYDAIRNKFDLDEES